MRWFGPAETRQVLVAETDVRVGGAYRVGFSTEDGREHHASGQYREVEPQRRLVFTWAWRDTPAEVSLITLEFTSAGGGTELAFLQTPFVDQATRDGHEHGWSGPHPRSRRCKPIIPSYPERNGTPRARRSCAARKN
jgi:uncharacterized protein YndB with AHSA1/START domain